MMSRNRQAGRDCTERQKSIDKIQRARTPLVTLASIAAVEWTRQETVAPLSRSLSSLTHWPAADYLADYVRNAMCVVCGTSQFFSSSNDDRSFLARSR